MFKNRFGSVCGFLIAALFIWAATRTALLIQSFADIDAGGRALGAVYTFGLLSDAVTFCYVILPFALYLALVPERVFHWKYHRHILYAIVAAFVGPMVFSAFAEYFFWDEFQDRFNFIAVDYLVYTNEVVGNIWESYPMPLVCGGIALVSAAVFAVLKKPIDQSCTAGSTAGKRLGTGLLFVSAALACYCCADLTSIRTSPNRYNRSLAENGIYTLFAAFRRNSLDYYEYYTTRSDRGVFKDLRRLVGTDGAAFTDTGEGALNIRRLAADHGGPERRMNVMLIMMESMSAHYLGAYGNAEGLTPSLDALAAEGIVFKNIYATGTRTVRGMEAVCLSVPPTPGRSLVKRPHNEHLNTIADIFRQRGYENKFLYGGYSYFDNMKHFFSTNGFAVVDRRSLLPGEITFENIWGVCDEDMLARTIAEADKSYRAGRNFFSFVMTTSNHRPYTFPAGKISLPAVTKHLPRKSAVKYADYAIGAFMAQARTRPWFDDTLFVIVADHCANSSGKTDLPIHRYRIPLIMYAPRLLRPCTVETLASQIDIGPTVFDLLNWRYMGGFFGRSILRMEKADERSFIGNYLRLGYIHNDMLTVLGPQGSVDAYRIDFATLDESAAAVSPDDLRAAIAYYQGAARLLCTRAQPLQRPCSW